MLKFGNKEFRNLQEQVYKNMQDISSIKAGTMVIDEFGIKVVGEETSIANMPTVEDYKENNPDWEYGDAYAIGEEAPYELYVLTRANGTHPDDYWFNIGEFPAPGPEGPEGPQGEQGVQGQTGPSGADGVSAGFGTVSASATTLGSNDDATVSVTTSGTNAAMNISFSFGIPQGQPGQDGSSEWGTITGDLDDQTDLVNALQAKQNTLVSGTNIKTINNTSLLGSGDITIAGGVSDVQVDGTSVVTGGVAEIDLSGYATTSDISDMATQTWVGNQGYLTSVSWSDVSSKPTFATVATSGDYDDLLNKPSIPAAQVNSDWNAVSGVAQILNKPTIPDISHMVTDNTTQTISGAKTFTGNVTVSKILPGGLSSSIGENGSRIYTIYSDILDTSDISTSTAEISGVINGNGNDYGLVLPSTTSYTANKTIATTDQIPAEYKVITKDLSDLEFTASDITTILANGGRCAIVLHLDDFGGDPADFVFNYCFSEEQDSYVVFSCAGFEMEEGDWPYTYHRKNYICYLTIDYNDSPTITYSFTNQSMSAPSNYVTTNTAQTISGDKTFTGTVTLPSSVTDGTYVFTLPSATGTLALTSDIPSSANFVTLAGDQTITGTKTFDSNVLPSGNYQKNLGNGSHHWSNIFVTKLINSGTYGVAIPDSSSWTANKTLATTDDIPSVPVTDVTVGGTSVVSSGTAVIPSVPTSASTTVSASSESFTFTYADGTTTTKTFLTAITSATTTLS